MAEEITAIIMNGGILTLNPNEDWTAEDHEEIHLPIAITAGILTLPISRAQARRWMNDSDWGAETNVRVMSIIHAPGHKDAETMKTWELGTHTSHLRKQRCKNGGYISLQMAERMRCYTMADIDDKPFLKEPIVVMFQRHMARRMARKHQILRLPEQDLLLYAPGEVPKEPKEYYSNVLPARKILENPDVCHDKGTKSIVEAIESIPIGDYRMGDWVEIAGTDEMSYGRIMEETPDKPLQGIGVGWHAELMDLSVSGVDSAPETSYTDNNSYGSKAKAEQKLWFALRKVVINVLRHWGARIPEKGEKHHHGCYIDSGGWAKLDVILEWVNGEAFQRATPQMQTAVNRENRHGCHCTCALPNKSRRNWNFTIEDIIRMAIHGDQDKFQILRAVCPTPGVSAPPWIRAKQGHTLRFIGPMRTSLHLFQKKMEVGDPSMSETEPYRCDMLEYIGNAVYYADQKAMRNMFFFGIRSDVSQPTDYEGKVVITLNPFRTGSHARLRAVAEIAG
jgi:hypothetical protein